MHIQNYYFAIFSFFPFWNLLFMNNNLHPRAFRHQLKVQESDIDELGHVNNVVYLRYVQEVAAAHWEAKTPEAIKKSYLWVVLRHEIDYHKPAFAGEDLVGYTWVGEHTGPKIERFVSLYKEGSDKPLAEAKTTWCLLDAESMRPKRITEEVLAAFQQEH